MKFPLTRVIVAVLATALAQFERSESQISPLGATLRVDAAGEVAASVYYMSTVVDALKKEAGAALKAKDARIRELERQIAQGDASASAELARLRDEVVAELSAKDAELARQVAAFRNAVEDIASTPEGAAILAQRRPGNLRQARELLRQLDEEIATADQRVVDLRRAKRLRSIATIALDDRSKGEATTEEVVKLFEQITRLDPGVVMDWVWLKRLYLDAGNSPDARRAAETAVTTAMDDRERAVALHELALVLSARGEWNEAQKSYQGSLAIFERLAKADPGNAGLQRELSYAYDRFGDVLANGVFLPLALKAYQDGLTIRDRLAKVDPSNNQYQLDLSVSFLHVGEILQRQGALPEALTSLRSSHAIYDRLARNEPGNAGLQHNLAVSYDRIANLQTTQGDLPSALMSYREGLTIFERLAKADPSNVGPQRDLAIASSTFGRVLERQGALTDALKSFREALAIRERLAMADPGNTGFQRSLSESFRDVGRVLKRQDALPEALQSYRNNLAIVDRLAKADPSNYFAQRDLIPAYSYIGDALAAQGKLSEALESYQDGVGIAQRLKKSPGDTVLASQLGNLHQGLSIAYERSDQMTEAIASQKTAVDLVRVQARLLPSEKTQKDLETSEQRLSDLIAKATGQ